jgi:pimeloyl-ACP methyl ester carboxylesterase
MALARLDDVELFYTGVGAGLPCLVMHGGPGVDHTCFRPWLDRLGDVLRLVYYDHRGNGRSSRTPPETFTLAQLAADTPTRCARGSATRASRCWATPSAAWSPWSTRSGTPTG